VIRFRYLFGVARELDRSQLAQVKHIYRRAFPYAPAYAEKIALWLEKRPRPDVDPVLIVAVGEGGAVTGFALILRFPDLKYAYLDYIASDPDTRARGIGGALYEAVRELLLQKGARGLFFDVPHDDPTLLKDPSRAEINKRRLGFYRRYGALPIERTLYDKTPTPANEGYMTHLVFDPLDGRRPLRAQAARTFLRALYERKYGLNPRGPELAPIVASFRDDPVRLRQPRRAAPDAPPAAHRRLFPVQVVTNDRHRLHHLKERGYVERPVRVDAVLKGLEGLGVEHVKPRHFGETPIRAVHTAALIGYLARASARLSPKDLIYPTVFPLRRRRRPPRAFEMRAGYYCIDTFTPLAHNSYVAARAAVDCTLTATILIENGERFAYALCRPPGHHAEPEAWGGFCYFNNAAVAAHRLSKQGKVALLDIDHHHGNGSQEIFYHRADVLVVNIHCHPDHAFPYFTGFADEKGAGPGKGFNRNYPLHPGTDDATYLKALDDACRHVTRYDPQFLVLSLGYDIMKGDPTGTFNVSNAGMRAIGQRIAAMRLPTLIVQEGGYSLGNLRHGARAFMTGLTATW
jgi:acetoin utilization deacetylase AcuC-like enzyme/GNAT superfamily N-acetyltransferase